METNVTFSGKESVVLTEERLLEAIKSLSKYVPVEGFGIEKLVHNLSQEKKEQFFGELVQGDNITAFMGTTVYKKSYVPLNEVWFVDKQGMPVRKFKI